MSAEEMNNAEALAQVINSTSGEDTAFLHGVVVGMRQANRSHRREEAERNAES